MPLPGLGLVAFTFLKNLNIKITSSSIRLASPNFRRLVYCLSPVNK